MNIKKVILYILLTIAFYAGALWGGLPHPIASMPDGGVLHSNGVVYYEH